MIAKILGLLVFFVTVGSLIGWWWYRCDGNVQRFLGGIAVTGILGTMLGLFSLSD